MTFTWNNSHWKPPCNIKCIHTRFIIFSCFVPVILRISLATFEMLFINKYTIRKFRKRFIYESYIIFLIEKMINPKNHQNTDLYINLIQVPLKEQKKCSASNFKFSWKNRWKRLYPFMNLWNEIILRKTWFIRIV